MQVLFVLTSIGFAVSVYALVVERKSVRNALYTPLCDVTDHISCTRAFKSRAGHLIPGIPNAFLGTIFYSLVAVLLWHEAYTLVVWASICSVLVSLYLAYVLIRQKNFCIVCFAVYIVNIAMLYTAVLL